MKIIKVSSIDYGLLAKAQYWVLDGYGVFFLIGISVKAGRRKLKIKLINIDGKTVKYKIIKK